MVILAAAVCFMLAAGCNDKTKKESNVEPDTIKYFRSVIDTTRTENRQRNARFMICYLYFNKFKDTAKARENMNEFLKLYPQNDESGTTESVRIMLDVLDGKK